LHDSSREERDVNRRSTDQRWAGISIATIFVGAVFLLTISNSINAQMTRRPAASRKVFLKKGWQIQSSAVVKESGDQVSTASYRSSAKWYPASVPSTVVGTLVDDKVYPDPFFGMNLRQIPGCSYPIGANFSLRPMPDDSPFRNSWWYRTEFQLPASNKGKEVWLHFDGINFRANVWLNGKRVAGADQIAGTFRIHEVNISEAANPGGVNTLAVEVFPAQDDDLGWTWVDWNPMPPDKNMGIFRDVYITTSGPVTIRYPQVVTHFDLPSLEMAHLTVNAELANASDGAVEGLLHGSFEGVRFSQPVKLAKGETKSVTFTPDQFPQLNVKHPRIWWPIHQGAQPLYDLEMQFDILGKLSDRQTTRFGIREVTSELDGQKHRLFKINGKNVLIRGGGWASDMFLRYDPERIKSEFEYVRDMNLNSIRLEGQLQPDHFFDLADELGILIMPGWCCCSHWEHWEHRDDYKEGPTWDKEDYEVARKSQEDQISRLRNHPSVFVWLNGSDNPPPADVEKMYIDVLKKYQWPNPYLSSATAKDAPFSGPTGAKMEGPYEWVPPSYWLLDKNAGGAHGFATEISPGPAVPPIETLRRMIPADRLWPINEVWNFHAGGGQFKDLDVFTAALNARYGFAKDAKDYSKKAQLMTYEGQRAMFEAYGGRRYQSTGVIQWMLNNAWPGMIWHLYDYFLMPAGGYFGTKKACEPVHVQYSYDDKSILIVNTTHQPLTNMKVTARLFDINFGEKFSKSAVLNLPADGNATAFQLPTQNDLSSTYFLSLALEDSQGKPVTSNFYWLSTKDDVLEREKTKWYYTPVSSYADMTDLEKLAPAKLSIRAGSVRRPGKQILTVELSNPDKGLAFFIHMKVTRGREGEPVLPILWEDNYISLAPGERRQITASYNLSDLGKASAFLSVEGLNVSPIVVPVSSTR
jgi:exo-1,4-beta-D-glucosaminidase